MENNELIAGIVNDENGDFPTIASTKEILNAEEIAKVIIAFTTWLHSLPGDNHEMTWDEIRGIYNTACDTCEKRNASYTNESNTPVIIDPNDSLRKGIKEAYESIRGACSMLASSNFNEPETDRDNDMFDYGLYYAYSVSSDLIKEHCPEIK